MPQKKSRRMGARFEDQNHARNVAMFGKDQCFQTPNSGAGDLYKGDSWIKSFVTAMQEAKTNVKPKISRGSSTYTCKRNELEKVKAEGDAAGVEFYYLKFRFLETDSDTYSIITDEIMDALLVTINEDRKKVKRAQLETDMYKARYEHIQAENVELEARIRLLEAELALKTVDSDNNFL